MTVTQLSRQPSPYTSNCSYEYPNTTWRHSIPADTKYSENLCKSMCLLEYVKNKCNCTDPLLMEASKEVQFENVTFCSTLYGTKDKTCTETYMTLYPTSKGGINSCPCQSACETNNYQVSNQS